MINDDMARIAERHSSGDAAVQGAIQAALEEYGRVSTARNIAGMTPRQRDALRVIKEHIALHGCPPSFDEIREAMGLSSKSGVKRLVDALVERGLIRMRPGRARSIALT